MSRPTEKVILPDAIVDEFPRMWVEYIGCKEMEDQKIGSVLIGHYQKINPEMLCQIKWRDDFYKYRFIVPGPYVEIDPQLIEKCREFVHEMYTHHADVSRRMRGVDHLPAAVKAAAIRLYKSMVRAGYIEFGTLNGKIRKRRKSTHS